LAGAGKFPAPDLIYFLEVPNVLDDPRVSDHPTPEELEGLVWNRVSAGRRREILRHVLGGCAECKAVLAPHFGALLGLAEPPEPKLSAQEEERYDAAVGRAFSSVLAKAREVRDARQREVGADASFEALPRVPEPLQGVPLFESLLQQSWALRHENPAEMVRLAERARGLAESMRLSDLSPQELADLQCRAWIELGNAYRVADDLAAAERALGRATEKFLEGTQDDLLASRLFSVQASLLTDGRRFNLAETALDLVVGIHQRRGDDHEAGRALLQKGMVAGYQGRSEEALQLITRGLQGLDEKRDPRLAHMALHNQAYLLLDTGQLREARIALWKARAGGLDPGGHVNELKVRWLEGRINLALGELERSETAFREVKDGFVEADLVYKGALAGLELGAVLLRQDRPEQAAEEILAAADIFMSLGIGREASASVLLLRRAAEQRIVDAALIDYVAAVLRTSEGAAEVRAEE
jgi:tetratricopeptide (TPR) repeat protein